MKKMILLLVLLTSALTSNAQRFKEVLMWEAETLAGGVIFGISETKEEADYIMTDFQKRNAGNKYEIAQSIPVYKYSTINVKSSKENPVESFKAAAGKPYKVLSAEDIMSMELIKSNGLSSAVDYYAKKRKTSKKYAKSRLNKLYNKLEKYRIQTSKKIVSSN